MLNSADELQEKYSFLQTLIDTIPSPIFYKDADGKYLGCNCSFEKYIGRPKEQLIGKSVYDIAPKDLADIYFKMDRELFCQNGTQVYEASVVYADGSRHNVVFNKATFLNNDGTVGGLVGVMVDITEGYGMRQFCGNNRRG